MNWLDRAIAAGVKKGVDQALEDHLNSGEFARQIRAIAMQNPRFAFIKHMQARYLERAPRLSDKASFELARDWLNDFLHSEKIEFGDPRYDWTRDGAITLADEDMQYWESAA